jgi:hypothetical protein
MYLLYFLLRLHTYIYIHLPYPSVHLLQRLSSLWKFYVKTTYLSFRHLLKRISLSGNICVSIISCQFPHELNLQKGGVPFWSLNEVELIFFPDNWMKITQPFKYSRAAIFFSEIWFPRQLNPDDSLEAVHRSPSGRNYVFSYLSWPL